MATEELIKEVTSNAEKGESYKRILANYNKAYRQGFYFEGLLLIYAVLEDRTSSILYHCGFTQEDDRRKTIGGKTRQDVRTILKGELKGFDSFSKKLNAVEKLLNWAQSAEVPQTEYQKYLKRSVNRSRSIEKILNTKESLNGDWREKRNLIIHGLANKDYFAAQDAAKELCEQGKRAFIVLNQFSKVMKNKDIRQKFNIQ